MVNACACGISTTRLATRTVSGKRNFIFDCCSVVVVCVSLYLVHRLVIFKQEIEELKLVLTSFPRDGGFLEGKEGVLIPWFYS